MTKEFKAIELNDADLDQVNGAGVVFEIEVTAKDPKQRGSRETGVDEKYAPGSEKGVLSSLQTG